MKKVVAVSLLLLSSLLIKAQDKKPQAQPDSVIKVVQMDGGRHSAYVYSIGGKLQTREDVLIRLMAYEPSAMEVKKAKTNITWTYISAAGCTLSAVAAVIQYGHNNKFAGETTAIVNGSPTFVYQKHNLTGAYVFTGIATGFLIANIINLTHAAKHAHKALKVYNEQFE